jgi:DNA-directed RNA polymerase subunit RPC12/RpoP
MAEYKCSICGEVFDNGDELAEHVRDAHPGQDVEDYECDICYERFETESDLTAHMSAAHSGS